MKDNMACLDLKLDASQVARLDEASRIDLGFPHEFYSLPMVTNLVYGGLKDRLDV